VDVIGKGVLPRLYEDLPNATAACEEFIRECVDLLVSGSIHVRETVKEALGQELPGNWMRIMIDHMRKWVKHLHRRQSSFYLFPS
jgi:neurofibromin 1